jgi:hypothetical protein
LFAFGAAACVLLVAEGTTPLAGVRPLRSAMPCAEAFISAVLFTGTAAVVLFGGCCERAGGISPGLRWLAI